MGQFLPPKHQRSGRVVSPQYHRHGSIEAPVSFEPNLSDEQLGRCVEKRASHALSLQRPWMAHHGQWDVGDH